MDVLLFASCCSDNVSQGMSKLNLQVTEESAFLNKETALDLIRILHHFFPCADVTLFYKSQQPSLDQ